jgi:hypothetical protein
MAASNWGEKGWSIGDFGTGIENAFVVITSQSLTSSLNSVSVTAEVNDGWGRSGWGQGSFGITGTVLIEGEELSTSISSVLVTAEVNAGWGAYPWGVTGWGTNTASPIVEVTGQNLTTSLSSVSFLIDGSVLLTGQQLTSLSPGFQTSSIQNVSGTSDNILFAFRPNEASKIQYVGAGWNVVGQPTFIVTAVSLDPNDQYTGTITITGGTFVSGQSYSFESPNVNITGTANLTLTSNLANLTLNSVDAFSITLVSVTAPGTPTTWGSNGWGQLGWEENIGLSTFEGTTTVDLITPVNVTGQLLSTSLNSVSLTIDGSVALTGQVLTAEVSSVGISADGNVSIPVFENPLVMVLGIIDPGPDANITGQQLTLTQGNVDIDIAVVTIVTGQLLSTSLNSVTIDLNTPVNVTGQNITTVLNSVTIGTNTPVNVTGNSLTGTTGQLYVGAWAPVNTGQSIVWTEVAA